MSSTPTLEDLQDGCQGWIDGVDNIYSYVPSLAAGVVFTVLFLLSAAGHLFRFVVRRSSPSILLTIGAVIELVGWAARIWSSQCPYNDSAFKTQVTLLVIGPVFFTAAIYLFLSQLIRHYGDQFSLLPPKAYLWIFISVDVLSLIIQAAGAGIASSQLSKPDGNPKRGSNIVAGGMLFQIAAMTVFVACFAVFLKRLYGTVRASGVRQKDQTLIFAIVFSLVVIYIRNIFRAIQLIQGFTGYLFVHERFFIAMDGAMMFLAVAIFHLVDVLPARERLEQVPPHMETQPEELRGFTSVRP
ncbi:RTA1 like protein-domain-containing protein [Aspergillus cavernicola]|uniref:RTA1 like protein-domain-containing protein n=1 Tax=Aspergillus cavernicola TaxID=176166 RepID=A0ABR4IUI0_9EURO